MTNQGHRLQKSGQESPAPLKRYYPQFMTVDPSCEKDRIIDRGIEGKVTTISSAPTKRYYRVDEVARYFSVCEQTVYRLIDMGDLKAIRVMGCIRVPVEELRAFEERQRDDSDDS